MAKTASNTDTVAQTWNAPWGSELAEFVDNEMTTEDADAAKALFDDTPALLAFLEPRLPAASLGYVQGLVGIEL